MAGERLRGPVASRLVRIWLQQCADEDTLDWWIATQWVADQPRVVTVQRVGGSRKNLVVDQPRLLVQCYGVDEDESESIASEVESMLNCLPGETVDGHFVYKIEWASGPVLYPDDQLRPRVQMTFSLDVRAQ